MTTRPLAFLIAAALTSVGLPSSTLASDPAATPLVFRKANRSAQVELRVPKALAAWPAFREMLITSDTAKLNGFVRTAEKPSPGRPVVPVRRSWRTIRYQLAGTTPRLISVIRRDDRDTGGAHPLPSVSAVIWDQRTKRRVTLAALLRPDADAAPLDEALCDAVKAAKAEREGSVPIDGKTWRCPLFSQTQAALAPSTVDGRAGGLIALISPYEVGPYAEGIYQVIIPLTAFRDALRRPYLTEFAGQPAEEAKALADAEAEPAPVPPPTPRARKRP